MNKTFFTSDVHFNHSNILKFCPRPFSSVEEMNEGLITNWNNEVGSNDTVWSLGDFAFTNIDNIKSILSRLNGNIHMVLGNHDQQIIKHKKELISSGLVKEIHPYREIKVEGQFICLHHYAQRTWNKCHYGAWHLFGHTHGSMEPYGKSVDVGIDSPFILPDIPYRPFSFDEIKQFMDKQPIIGHY